MKQLLRSFLFLISISVTAQQTKTNITGVVKDSLDVIEDAHIYNITTKKGTFTNEKGEFSINVSLGDKLQVTSVAHIPKDIIVANITLKQKKLDITLHINSIVLEEIRLRNRKVIGTLEIDAKMAPKDSMNQIARSIVLDIMSMDINEILNMPIGADEAHLKKVPAPNPIKGFAGVGSGASLDNWYVEKQRKKKKRLRERSKFPKKVINHFGRYFFEKQLKIPKDKIYHFIDYCTNEKLELLFKKKDYFKMIRIFQEESVGYHKLIK